MAHKKRYAIMTYFEPIQPSGSPDFSEMPAQKGLVERLTNLTAKLPEAIDKFSPDYDWEINSHSLTLAGNTIIVSILLRRNQT